MQDHNSVEPQMIGVILSMVIAIIRVIYEHEETHLVRVILEALFCGALSLALYYGIMAMGLNVNWAVFGSGMIGYFGSTAIKSIAFRLLEWKVGRDGK